ncbi:MAG TPA: NADH-quinone oxidoreductase subunit G, partial [Propionibacteriaceae bacterium]|nr:NADH-quinone oxidoreductase subunit G [Propionibacteriaceae bacterium]
PFVISIEQRTSEVTSRADVVFPVALIEEKAGTFLNWEHRPGRVTRVNRQAASPMTDLRVLAALADALGTSLGIRTPKEALTELESLGAWEGARAAAPTVPVAQQLPPEQGAFRIASWRQLIDGSRGNDGALDLLVTAKPAVARINAAAAEALGVTGGDPITIFGVDGDRVLPVVVEPGMVDSVVWLPGDLGVLGIKPGDVVRLTAGGVA